MQAREALLTCTHYCPPCIHPLYPPLLPTLYPPPAGPGIELDFLCQAGPAFPGQPLPPAQQLDYPMPVEACASACMFSLQCMAFTFTLAGVGRLGYPDGFCNMYQTVLPKGASSSSLNSLPPAQPPTSHACLKLTSHGGPSLVWSSFGEACGVGVGVGVLCPWSGPAS